MTKLKRFVIGKKIKRVKVHFIPCGSRGYSDGSFVIVCYSLMLVLSLFTILLSLIIQIKNTSKTIMFI
jgi:hypothetical protein